MAKKGEVPKIIVFATVTSLVFGSILLSVGYGLSKRIARNKLVERYGHILKSLGVKMPEKIKLQAIIDLYKKSVRKRSVKGVMRYEYKEKGHIKSYAFDLDGMGLWAPIKGFMALEPDLCTVKQVSFYQQEETPGLGAEIVKKFFTKQFKGKKITRPCNSNNVILHVRKKGMANKKIEVDGISGATMTIQGVEKLVQKGIQKAIKTRGAGGQP